MCAFVHVYYLFIALNGKLTDHWCNEEALQQANMSGVTVVTMEECKSSSKTIALVDCAFSLLFSIYFATVIMRWSKNDEGWHRA